MSNPQIRLNKFLAERLGISRREADELISAGKITIDGRVAKLGDRVSATSTGGRAGGTPTEPCDVGEAARTGPVEQQIIRVDNEIVPYETKYIYLAFNKPIGYVCSRRAQGPAPTLYDLLPAEYRKLKTVGRLDKDSSGLILLTNDGDFAFQMTHPKFRKNKVYEVELNKSLQPIHQQMISDFGVMLDDGPSRFMVVRNEIELPVSRSFGAWQGEIKRQDPCGDRGPGRGPRKGVVQSRNEKKEPRASYTVVLSEGRNRQIRRTFAALGYKVTKLHRTHFGKYELGDLAPGKYAIIKP